MVGRESQVWIRKQDDEKKKDARLHKVLEPIRQARRGKCTASIKIG